MADFHHLDDAKDIWLAVKASFKTLEIDVKGASSYDSRGEDEEKGAAQVYGMIAGDDDDAAGDASSDVSDAAAEFALMGLSLKGKPLYDRFVKAVGMHAVPPPITGTFMPPSNMPDLDDTQVTYGSKSNNHFETNSVSNNFCLYDNIDKSLDSGDHWLASWNPPASVSLVVLFLLVILVSKLINLQVPKILTYMQVNETSDMVESSSDYAEELARLQKQAYEANATAEKNLSQADLATSRNRVPAGKVVSAAGVTEGPTDPPTPVFKPVHTAAPSLPPGHSLGSSEHSTRYPSPSDLANSMSSYSELEDIHHHPDSGIFSSSSYDDDFGGTVTNLAPSVVVDSVPTKRVNTIHPQSQILGDLTSPVQNKGYNEESNLVQVAFV
ncbi:hypothetical protein Tco_0520731 [Tanacetum coccineum]